MIDEALGGRPLRLGLLNRRRNARQRAVTGCGGNSRFYHAVSHNTARVERVTDLFIHRQALAGNRRLIQSGVTGFDTGVEWYARTGTYPDAAAHGYPSQCLLLPSLSGLYLSGFRSQCGQRFDRIARPF